MLHDHFGVTNRFEQISLAVRRGKLIEFKRTCVSLVGIALNWPCLGGGVENDCISAEGKGTRNVSEVDGSWARQIGHYYYNYQ